jgi:peptidoglycan/LPS O-acetylase OafA/YrhL
MGKIMRINNQDERQKNWGFLRKIERSTSIKYHPELDGIRGIAIFCVVSAHLGLIKWLPFGTDIFFVLSGYLITDILLTLKSSPSRLKKFYLGRAARLFPVLILYTLVGCIISFTLLREFFNTTNPIASLLQIKNFFQLSESYRDVWAITWAMSAIEQFYAIWPFLLFFLIKKIRKRYFIILISFYILAAHRSLIILIQLWPDFFNRSFDYAEQVIAVIIRPSEILLGCLVVLTRPFSRMFIFWLFATATCGAAFLGVSEFLIVALATTSLLALLEIPNLLSKILCGILSNKLLVSLGILSYSIYLWHALIYIVAFEHFGRDIQVKLIVIALTLIVSYTSYIWFEIPLKTLINQRYIKK